MRNVILGTDWWTDCDDGAAVRIACRLSRDGAWKLRGVVINACMEQSAASLELFVRGEGCELPIGLDRDATDFGGRLTYQKPLVERFGSNITNDDCEDGVRLYRKLLAGLPDGSAEIMEIGFLQVVAALLDSGADDLSPLTGFELVKSKVKRIFIMGGRWDNNGRGSEHNFALNRRASLGAHRVLEVCPCEVCLLGFEVGQSVITTPRGGDDDCLCRLFEYHGSKNGRSSWDPMLVLLAADCPDTDDKTLDAAGYRACRGTASVDSETGENSFRFHDDGRHFFVVKTQPDEWYKQRIEAIVNRA